MPNVHTLDHEHTPVRGIPLVREPDVEQRDPDAPRYEPARKRSLTGLLMMRSRDGEGGGTSISQILLAALLFGGGGAGVSTLMSPAIEPERIAAAEMRIDQHERDLGALNAKTKAIEVAAQRDSVATMRWVVEVLSKQNNALAAIAAQLDVDVDLTLPPLVMGAPVPQESTP